MLIIDGRKFMDTFCNSNRMFMKQITFFSLFIFGVSACCFAQQDSAAYRENNNTLLPVLPIAKEPRFLVNIHSGYAFGLGSTFKFYPDDIRSISVIKTDNNTPLKSTSYSNPSKGLGDGFRIGAGFSYILNDFINLGMDLDYFESTISKVRDSSYRQTTANPPMGEPDDYSYSERTKISYDATLLTLTPHITFKAISRPKWFIYNKLGAVITFRPNSLEHDVTDITIRKGWQGFFKDSASKISTKYDWGIKNPAVGFMGAFGMQVKIAERIRAFGELQFSHIVFVVRKRTLMDFTVDGADMKNTLPVSVKEIEFVKSFTTDFSNSNPNQPSQTLIQRIPITYIGMQFGIAYQIR